MGRCDIGLEPGAGVVAGVERKFRVEVLARLVAEVGASSSGVRCRSGSVACRIRETPEPANVSCLWNAPDVVSSKGRTERLAWALVTSFSVNLLPPVTSSTWGATRFFRSRGRGTSAYTPASDSRARSLSLLLFRLVTLWSIASTSSSSGTAVAKSSSKNARRIGESGTGLGARSRPSATVAVIETLVSGKRPLCRRGGRRFPALTSCSSNSNCNTSTAGGDGDLDKGTGRRLEVDDRGCALVRFFGKVGLDSGRSSRSTSSGDDWFGSSSSMRTGIVGGRAIRLGGGETLGSGIGRLARGGGGCDSGVVRP